jgi:riboflavin kinase/FMN adenylyltransferase
MTIGNFDGVHLGHQDLLRRVMEDARSRGGSAVVLTFEPHPLKILAPSFAPRLILARKDKLALLRRVGIDFVVIQRFTSSFCALSPHHFVSRYLVRLGVERLWVGENFRFGKDRAGTVKDLMAWGPAAGMEVEVIPAVADSDRGISSSRIRALLEEGRVDTARRQLGRCHFIEGSVVKGHQRGRELGFPTANVRSRTEVVPANGIYATLVQMGGRQMHSVTSIGVNPTFGSGPRTIETHILDFKEDLYGRRLQVFFLERLREERNFPSVEGLVKQIEEDIACARGVLSRNGPESTAMPCLTKPPVSPSI